MSDAAVDAALRDARTVVLLGPADAGKTTSARHLLQAAVHAGRSAALVDLDVGQSTVGPPLCAGLHWVRAQADLDDLWPPDALAFVGDLSAVRVRGGHLEATARLLTAARPADLVVVDTPGMASGPPGEDHALDLLAVVAPAHVWIVDPDAARACRIADLAGALTSGAVWRVPVAAGAKGKSRPHRAGRRQATLRRWFSQPLRASAVLPPMVPDAAEVVRNDPARLHRQLVGSIGRGGDQLGVLEHEDGRLRLRLPEAAPAPRLLRLAAAKADEDWHPRQVDLRALW